MADDVARRSVEVTVAIPADRFDKLYARSRTENVSIAELVRRELERARRFERLLLRQTPSDESR
jgi:CRP-like cAMP-binding protein